MNIKSNKEFSFGRLIDEGKSKEEICALKGMTSKDYDKALVSLLKVREDAKLGLLPKQQKDRFRHTGVSKKWEK
jgi:hypothetical protein